jgi:hypothetical protein
VLIPLARPVELAEEDPLPRAEGQPAAVERTVLVTTLR